MPPPPFPDLQFAPPRLLSRAGGCKPVGRQWGTDKSGSGGTESHPPPPPVRAEGAAGDPDKAPRTR